MKVNPEHLRWLIAFPLQALLLILVRQLNFSLAEYSLFIFVFGGLLIYPCAFFPLGHAIANTFLLSFFYEAGFGWTPGSLLVPSLLILMAMITLRRRLHYYNGQVYRWVALAINAILFLVLTLQAGKHLPMDLRFWTTNFWHITLSSLVLILSVKWILAMYNSWLGLFDIQPFSAVRAQKK